MCFASNGQTESVTNEVATLTTDLTLPLSGGSDRFMYQNGKVFGAQIGDTTETIPTLYTSWLTSFDASKPYCDIWGVVAQTKEGKSVSGTVIIPNGTTWESTYLEGTTSSDKEPVVIHAYLSCFKGVINGTRVYIDATTNRDELIAVLKGLIEFNK